MSAYFVHEGVLHSILGAAMRHGVQWPAPLDQEGIRERDLHDPNPDQRQLNYWSAIGRLLWRENEKSLRYRYSDAGQEWAEDFAAIDAFTFKPQPDTDEAALECCEEYDYQSCEHDGWEASNAKAFIDALCAKLEPGAR